MNEIKEWIDEIIDKQLELNALMREHGAGMHNKNILIYLQKSEERGDTIKYGFCDVANALGEKIIVEPKEKEEDGRTSAKMWFKYREFEIQTWKFEEEK